VRISDIVQHAELHVWAELALVMFLGLFFVDAIRVLRTEKGRTREMAMTPFDDSTPEEVRDGEHN